MKTQLLALVLLASCTTVHPEKSRGAVTVKPGAPSFVENPEVTSGSAKIAVRFEGAGENVGITVSGIEGLTVTSASEAHAGRTVKSGDVLPVDVTFTGTGHVVLTVQGTFHGAVQSRVHTVRVGSLKDDGSKVQVTSDGDAVKLIP